MSGGIAYVLDVAHSFASKVNMEMVELGRIEDPAEIAEVRQMLEDHRHFTGSQIADRILRDFHHILPLFVKVLPLDYKRVLEEKKAKEIEEKKRLSTIDFVPSQTASRVDLLAEGLKDGLISRNPLSRTVSGFDSNLPTPGAKPHEPALVDLEDSMMDEKTTREKLSKLDKTRG